MKFELRPEKRLCYNCNMPNTSGYTENYYDIMDINNKKQANLYMRVCDHCGTLLKAHYKPVKRKKKAQGCKTTI